MTDHHVSAGVKVFLTGGSGFPGKAVVDDLLARDCPLQFTELTVYDIAPYDGPASGRFEFIQGDILDYESLKDAMTGAGIRFASTSMCGTWPEPTPCWHMP